MKTISLVQRKAAILSWIMAFGITAMGQSTTEQFTLEAVKVTGLIKYDEARVVSTSGLNIDQKVTIEDIENAAQTLTRSGFFRSIKYNYGYNQGKMDVEFQVEEAANLLSCSFDNFVWFRTEELLAAIQKEMPLFSGSLPQSGLALQKATKVLEELLYERKLPGKIAFMMKEDRQRKQTLSLMFTISNVNLPIKAIAFSGTTVIPEDILKNKSKYLLGQQYSGTLVSIFAAENLVPLFREKGYLRIQFKEPEVKLESGSAVDSPVIVILQVIEGREYRWDKAVWKGDLPLPPGELDRIIGMKNGDSVNGLNIDKGLGAVTSEMNKNGYIESQSKAEPDFNDANHSVVYNVEIVAGSQYRMGSLTFKGVSEAMEKRLKSKCKIGAGEIFNPGYFDEFLRKDAQEEVRVIRPREMGVKLSADRKNKIVNVEYEFQ